VNGRAFVDHLVVAADSLAQGVAWCEATLGVLPAPGGRHPLMGTHNRLLKVASPAFPDAYLEIIAIDPDAPAPGRVRWFGLDDEGLRARLKRGPRLIHVVARTSALDAYRLALVGLGLQPGEPLQAGRDTPRGRLAWTILVRPDGALPCRGALPTLIQWVGRHPTADMADSGVALKSLALRGVPAPALELLRVHGATSGAGPGAPLQAVFGTPRGEVVLESDAGSAPPWTP
jgi:hypothetical protein